MVVRVGSITLPLENQPAAATAEDASRYSGLLSPASLQVAAALQYLSALHDSAGYHSMVHLGASKSAGAEDSLQSPVMIGSEPGVLTIEWCGSYWRIDFLSGKVEVRSSTDGVARSISKEEACSLENLLLSLEDLNSRAGLEILPIDSLQTTN